MLSHLGRPKGKDENLSLKNILGPVSKTLDKPVVFFQDCIGEEAEQATKKLQPGEIILMENLRFYKEETDGDKLFAEKLSRLGDLYINDAFGTCHREHASTAVIAKYFPNEKYVGKLLQKELEAISQIAEHGEKPVLAILFNPPNKISFDSYFFNLLILYIYQLNFQLCILFLQSYLLD